MLSHTTEYALRAMVHLAAHYGEPQTTQQIGQAAQVSPAYLSKILQILGRAHLLSAQRGLRGGYTLTRSPAEITIYEIMQEIEPIPRIETCPLGLQNHGIHLCSLHRRMDDAFAQLEQAFRSHSLQDLLEDANPSKPLCPLIVRKEAPKGAALSDE